MPEGKKENAYPVVLARERRVQLLLLETMEKGERCCVRRRKKLPSTSNIFSQRERGGGGDGGQPPPPFFTRRGEIDLFYPKPRWRERRKKTLTSSSSSNVESGHFSQTGRRKEECELISNWSSEKGGRESHDICLNRRQGQEKFNRSLALYRTVHFDLPDKREGGKKGGEKDDEGEMPSCFRQTVERKKRGQFIRSQRQKKKGEKDL